MRIATALLLLTLTITLSGCDEQPRPRAQLPAPEADLAVYQAIRIGGQRLTLPTIALLASTHHSNLTLADGNQVPIQRVLTRGTNDQPVAVIHLNLDAYRELQDYDLDTFAYVSRAFCPQLHRHWERNHCEQGLYDGTHAFQPRYITLVDRAYLLGSKEQLFANAGSGPTGGDAARQLLTQGTAPPISCVPSQQPQCVGVRAIRENLLAVWVTKSTNFDAEQKQVGWLIEQYLGP